MKIKRKSKKVNRSFLGSLGINVIMMALAAFMALPMVYAISNAFKPLDELFLFPPRFFVRHPTLDNFFDLFIIMSNSWVPFSRYIFNTFFITAAGTTGHILLASLCAFALSKHDFPGRNLIFNIIVLALMFSAAVTAIPNYLTIAKLGWLDSYAAVIIPSFAAPLGLYLMKQFMETIPDSLLESARIDGSSEFGVFWHIAMPTVKPAWLTLILLSVQSLWNTTGGAFVYSEQLKPLSVALYNILQGGIARAGVGAAVSVVMMTVPVVIFVLAQANIIETFSTSGMKD